MKCHPRPAAMGYSCDAVYRNPDYQPDSDAPLLIRCQDEAVHRLILADDLDTYTVKRCPICAGILHAQVEQGATFEILSEESI